VLSEAHRRGRALSFIGDLLAKERARVSIPASPGVPVKIAVVLGTPERNVLGERVARFVLARSAKVPNAEFALLDLAGSELPFFDEAIAP
jgi:hypothetical protein